MHTRLPLALLTAAFACALTAAVATAAPRDRVFVASYGTDSGNTTCSFTQPCRTFANALLNVAVGGEVTAIDSAGFGPVTITQSVTITSPNGVEAGIVPTAGADAVTINPTAATVVTLHGLTLEGSDTGGNGIVYNPTGSGNGPAVLNIIGCVVKDFTSDGILLTPGLVDGDRTFVFIADSAILNNASNGIEINPQTTVQLDFTIEHTSVQGNARPSGAGILINASSANSSLTGLILSSSANGNGIGLSFVGGSFSDMSVWMRNSVAVLNLSQDLISNSGGTSSIFLFSSQIARLNNVQGTIFSDGSNNIGHLAGNALASSPQQ